MTRYSRNLQQLQTLAAPSSDQQEYQPLGIGTPAAAGPVGVKPGKVGLNGNVLIECWAGSQEGTQPGQFTPSDQRDIPSPMMTCSAIKTQGKEDEGGSFAVRAFVFPRKHYA